jgi:O-acetyl-ADP-ribose deacetylase (regulator of RNase III)
VDTDVYNRIRLEQGDITKQRVDAIVNAANSGLAGGGGVDGAIHRAAGPELLEECRGLWGCPTGEARITKGYRLPAKHVIHTVGPVYHDGKGGEPALLSSAYRRSLELAREHGVRTIAFPAISTGAYRFPKRPAAEIALRTAIDWLGAHELPETVVFVLFADGDLDIYAETLARLRERTERTP